MTPLIQRIDAADTHELRRRVLRDGTPSTEVALDGDAEPTTIHLGAIVDDEVVGVATLIRRCDTDPADATADPEQVPAFQLRGMATDPRHRGRGIGAALVTAALATARREGAVEVWAHARVPALAFYHRLGFDDYGDRYLDAATDIEHQNIRLRFDRPNSERPI